MRKRITSLLLVLGMLSMLVPALAEGPTKLPKPTVQWLTESTVIEGVRCSAGEAILTDIPQDILPNFRMVLKDASGQVLEDSNDGFGGNATTMQRLPILHYIEEPLSSGRYTLTVNYIGDGETYLDSDPVTVSFDYTDPGVRFSTPTDVRWEDNDFKFTLADDVDPNHGASLFAHFAFLREDGSIANVRYVSVAVDGGTTRLHERFNQLVDRNGAGNYKFRIRVTSSNITEYQYSDWSEWSEPFYISGDSEETSGTLEEIINSLPEGTLSDEQKWDAVYSVRDDVDRNALMTDLAADSSGTGTGSKLAQLEEKLGLSTDVQVAPDAEYTLDPSAVTVVGAGLNAASLGTNPTLKFGNPDGDRYLPSTYQNVVQMEITLENAQLEEGGVLPVPIRITMPVPGNIDPAKLRILHFYSNGTSESITPYRFQDNEVEMISFTVGRLSPFVFAQLERHTVSFNANGGTVSPTSALTNEEGHLDELPTPTKAGSSFTGWYTALTDGEPVNESYTFTRDTEIYALWSTGGGGGGGGGTSVANTYAVNVRAVENGRVTASYQSAAKDRVVTITVSPNPGYVLDTLTVTDSAGGAVALTQTGEGTYTFTMPARSVTIEAFFKIPTEEPQALPFTDVSQQDWYYEAVSYVYDQGLMEGISEDQFAPNALFTRGMMAQVLYNMEGRSGPTSISFWDVDEQAWYADAVSWAAGNSIVNGYTLGHFGPDAPLTREQAATMLYRYAQYKGYDTTGTLESLEGFADMSAVSGWANSAMCWAVDAGVLNGTGNGHLEPTGTATRSQVAQILMNYCQQVME